MTQTPSTATPAIEHRSSRAPLLSSVPGRVAAIAVGAAFIAAMVLVPGIQLAPGVPLTLQVFAVALLAFLFDGRTAAGATALYVLMGALGLPVFSNFRSGAAVLVGPTGGYLIGFVLAAAVIGFLSNRAHGAIRSGKAAVAVAIMLGAGLVGLLVIHTAGVIGLMTAMGVTPAKASTITSVFLPFDALKIIVAALVAVAVLRAFRRQLLTRP